MWNDPPIMQRMRDAARKDLPASACLLRDRGDALFVTNADVPAISGFSAVRRGKMTALYPEDGWISEFEASFRGEDSLCGSAARFIGQTPTPSARALFIRGAKLTEGKNTDAERTDFDRAARGLTAIALRTGEGGGAYAVAAINAILQNQTTKPNGGSIK